MNHIATAKLSIVCKDASVVLENNTGIANVKGTMVKVNCA